jgi:hypothetical protein
LGVVIGAERTQPDCGHFGAGKERSLRDCCRIDGHGCVEV